MTLNINKFNNFLIYMSLFIDNYNKNTGYFEIVCDYIKNKKIIIYIITRLNGVKKFIIIPYKSIIKFGDYSYNYKNKDFRKLFLEILCNININSIVNIIETNTFNTRINSFN